LPTVGKAAAEPSSPMRDCAFCAAIAAFATVIDAEHGQAAPAATITFSRLSEYACDAVLPVGDQAPLSGATGSPEKRAC